MVRSFVRIHIIDYDNVIAIVLIVFSLFNLYICVYIYIHFSSENRCLIVSSYSDN